MATDDAHRPGRVPDLGVGRTYARLREYVIVDGDRYLLGAALVALAITPLAALEAADVYTVDEARTPLFYLYSTLAASNVTLITIVVSINQLVLSRELRSPGELETEMTAAEEFRSDVQAETDRLVVPEDPADFLEILVSNTRDDLLEIVDACHGLDATTLSGDVDEFADTLEPELATTLDELEATGTGVFPALATILDANFSTQINYVRWFVRANEDAMPEDLTARLEDLEAELEQLDVARQYFKTVYITQELADLSRLMLSTGLVAVVVSLTLIVLSSFYAAPLPPLVRPVLVPATVAVALVPLTLLVTHVLRIATVARRTAAITPFLSPSG